MHGRETERGAIHCDFLKQADLEALRGLPLEPIDPAAGECVEVSDARVRAIRPRVSVLVLAYNHAAYLGPCLDSLVAQRTTFAYEILVAEDASRDPTRSIALAYQQRYPERIRVLYSDRNVGATANAYRARLRCRGEYRAICEGDDYWNTPDKLQRQVEILDRYPHVGLVFGAGRFRRGGEERAAHGWGRASQELREGVLASDAATAALLRREWHPLTCTCMIRRYEWPEGAPRPFWMRKLAMGDTLAWLEALRGRDAYFLEGDWGTQVLHAESATDGIGRHRVTRDSCLALAFFAAFLGQARLAREHQVNVLKARLALASATRDIRESGRVLAYCWQKRVRMTGPLLACLVLAPAGGVAWAMRLRSRQLGLEPDVMLCKESYGVAAHRRGARPVLRRRKEVR